MATERIGKYLTVEQVESKAKTKVWTLHGSDDSPLGVIRWYSAWRQYTFWPVGSGTVLNVTCLDDLSTFIRTETQKHMEALTARYDSERTAPYSG